MKFHGIHESQTSTVNAIRNSSVTSRKKTCSTAGLSKKRKLNPLAEANLNTDDDEGLPYASTEPPNTKLKTERRGTKVKTEPVKNEPSGDQVIVTKKEEVTETKHREASPLEEKASNFIMSHTIPVILEFDQRLQSSFMSSFK